MGLAMGKETFSLLKKGAIKRRTKINRDIKKKMLKGFLKH